MDGEVIITMKIAVVNGPNLNFAGIREPLIYGRETLAEINKQIEAEADILAEQNLVNIFLEFFQSNSEGALIDFIQKCHLENFDGLIINPGAFAHYSYALRDAVASVAMPAIEVHMSNPNSREDFRQKSVISPVCRGVICGFRTYGYTLAIQAIIKINLEVFE